MKLRNIIKYAVCVLLAAGSLASCTERELEIIDEMDLLRCLEPMNLNAKVNSSLGDVVTFSWDVTKDAEYFMLSVYTDSELSKLDFSERVEPSNVPFMKKLTADQTYWFTVQAFSEKKEASKVAKSEKSFKTYAVKDNLFLKVTARTANSVSLAWSKDVADYADVDRIEVSLPGAEEPLATKTLGAEEIAAAAATVEGLTAGTEYVATLYFKSASRGQVNVWTAADVTGLTEVSDLAGLQNALKTPGAKVYLKLAGSPYDIESMDINNGFSIIGEADAAGNRPVLNGEFHITDAWEGKDLYFENVTFDGAPTATAASGFGFALQNKNGGSKDGKVIGDVTYKNCVITNYTKGLIYEWGKAMVLGNVRYDSCDITNINIDGSVGGDVFDIRQATTIESLTFVNNTIAQGMRTFIRIDAGSIGALVVDNNTLWNINVSDNSNNAGVFGLQIKPGSTSFKNNLFLDMTAAKAALGLATKSDATTTGYKYMRPEDLSIEAANNWYYNVVETYFTETWTAAKTAFSQLSVSPCYNAPGGYFNILPSSEIAGKNVGASKWWTPYVEEPEDLTLGVLDGAHTWNLGNARNWSGTIKKEMVRDELLLSASEENPVVAENGGLSFGAAVVTDRKQVPADNFLAFKVATPGSVIARATGEGTAHFYIATKPLGGGEVTVKGGVSPIADAPATQKIVISDISEPSMVYICPTGEVAIAELAWSTDVSAVNTALPAPAPVANPSSFTAGEAADVTVSWEAVDNAASYSVVFNGKTFAADGLQYVIEGKTTSMLDAGSYTVAVYANPGANDIYNTQSEAGVAAFAVLPKGGSEEGEELVVKDVEGLLSAIAAGKEEITLDAGEYDLGGVLTVTAPLALKGSQAVTVKGGFKLSGNVGVFSVDGIKVDAAGQGIFIDLDSAEGVTADGIFVANAVISGFAKSVIYASNTADKFQIDDIIFNDVEVYNHGTGQGMFDLRNGKYLRFILENSTFTGGRDFLRIDAPCSIHTVQVKTNTMYNLNTSKNGNGIFYVRAEAPVYRVEKNLLLGMTSGTVIGKAGAKVPVMSGNYYYNCNDDVFFTGIMDKETALGGQGVILTVDPVKDAANNDFTVVNGVVMSAKVGAPRWNPTSNINLGGGFRVTSVDEFQAAIDAGKNNIVFAPGEYDLSASNITLTGETILKGEAGAVLKVSQINLAEGNLGNIIIEGLNIIGGANNLIAAEAAAVVERLHVRNCIIHGVGKSIFYGNNDGVSINSVNFTNNVITGLGGGQGTFDIRKGAYTSVLLNGNTIVGGRDFIRADAGKVSGAVTITNNTFDGVTLNNGNGVLYVRSTPNSYVLKNNLFLNENGDNNLLSKAATANVIAPTEVASNYFYNCTAEKFWTGVIDKDVALANGGVILANNPVKDAANGDYTLVDALCLASNVGAPRWNPNAGTVSPEIVVNNVAELVNAIDASKKGIVLRAGTYDLRESVESGVINLIAPVSLSGVGKVEIVGSFKLGVGVTDFGASGIIFNGAEKAMGNTFEIAEATQLESIMISECEFVAYNKSIFYGNGADSKVGTFSFTKNLVHGFGTGQGMLDIRKGIYDVVNISANTFYDGGRDFVRIDKDIAGSIAITNNTFSACSLDAGNGLLWIRSLADEPAKYVVKKNLFLNMKGEGGKTILAKSGAAVPTMSENWFFNVDAGFFGGAISQEVAVGGNGGVLEADPCAGSATGDFKLTNEALKTADIGDPRWNSSSPRYIKKK